MAEQVTFLLKVVGHINQRQDGNLNNREVLTDCLTDLMHFAYEEGIAFDECLDMASSHYRAERREYEHESQDHE